VSGGGGDNAGERVRLRLLISGRVQGVAYRYCMADQCRQLGVAGWVRNLANGSVEAEIEGDPKAVESVVAWARQGPPAARVVEVITDERPVRSGTGFEVAY
jgi:acylphosphatase